MVTASLLPVLPTLPTLPTLPDGDGVGDSGEGVPVILTNTTVNFSSAMLDRHTGCGMLTPLPFPTICLKKYNHFVFCTQTFTKKASSF